MSDIVDRFMRYISIDTQSDEESHTSPSTSKQLKLARLLCEELVEMGASNIRFDEQHCYVYGEIPAAPGSKEGDPFRVNERPAIGFISHIDTAPGRPGDASGARIHKNYDGGIIKLNDTVELDPAVFPELRDFTGCDLIVTDGVSLLGADDKAGIAEIMTMAERLLSDPSIPHGRIGIAFTPDEEIGAGAEHFDIEGFGMDFAYTVDGGRIGELQYENFNAAEVRVHFIGRDVHPGSACGVMVNAARIAAEFDSMLPQEQRPECTDGYDGFFHMTRLEGTCADAESRYIIRDHDAGRFEQKKLLLRDLAGSLNSRYGNVITIDMRDQYFNMRELIEPHMFLIDDAKDAFIKCGVEPLVIPIRGGTDGAVLTFKGLPCPNLSTGGMNFHSNAEYIPVQSMETMADVLVEIARAK